MQKKITLIALSIFIVATLMSCSSNDKNPTFQKNPLDELIKGLNTEQNFSILLYDMDYIESSDTYKHKYQVIVIKEKKASVVAAGLFANKIQTEDEFTTPDKDEFTATDEDEKAATDTAYSKITAWKTVSPAFFEEHLDDMGMEIASKIDGKLEKKVAPPGYSNYVGNKKYGQWQQNNSGNQFWSFYGRYAFMGSMFHLAMMPVRYSMWNNYHSMYRPYGRSYYGENGNSRMYGTGSSYNSRTMSNTNYEKKPASFKNNIRSRVARSKSTMGTSKNKVKKTTRSTNRTSRPSMRSRSRGTGK